ncbi:MAG TPA: carbohydrate ABC transporter permease [Roseiflexaceae bacterium]
MIGSRHAPRWRRSLGRAAVALALLWTLFPIWWAFALSIKRPPDFFTARILPFVQFRPTLDNWRAEWRALGDPAGLGRGLANSTLVAGGTAVVSIALGLPAAFGLALARRARHAIWPLIALFLLPRILPPVVTALPFAALVQWLGLSDTALALVVADTTFALPLVVLVLLVAIADLPTEMLDAAQIDGCDLPRALSLIVVPLLAPVLLSCGALCFAQSWNEFLYALLNVQQRAQTAPLAVAALLNKDGIEFEYVGSHLLLVTLPPLLLALAARRSLVRGLSLGTLDDPAHP